MARAKTKEAPTDNLAQPFRLDRSAFKLDCDQPALRTDLRVAFGDASYRFNLDDRQVSRVEMRVPVRKRDSAAFRGPPVALGALYGRLARGRAVLSSGQPILAAVGTSDLTAAAFFRQDVELVIGHGLIGGGDVDSDGAASLVDRYVVDAPLAPLATLAFAIVGVRLFGREPDPETGE